MTHLYAINLSIQYQLYIFFFFFEFDVICSERLFFFYQLSATFKFLPILHSPIKTIVDLPSKELHIDLQI